MSRALQFEKAAQMTLSTDLQPLVEARLKLRELVRDWADRKAPLLPAVDQRMELVVERPNGVEHLRAKITTRATGLVNNVLHAAAALLASPDVRARICPECHQLFIPVRRQERHPDCARRARDSKRPDRGKRSKGRS